MTELPNEIRLARASEASVIAVRANRKSLDLSSSAYSRAKSWLFNRTYTQLLY